MSLSWHKRKTRLNRLLKSTGDENEDGMALDRILHGQRVIGKTCKRDWQAHGQAQMPANSQNNRDRVSAIQ
jgi:hypothetical protein